MSVWEPPSRDLARTTSRRSPKRSRTRRRAEGALESFDRRRLSRKWILKRNTGELFKKKKPSAEPFFRVDPRETAGAVHLPGGSVNLTKAPLYGIIEQGLGRGIGETGRTTPPPRPTPKKEPLVSIHKELLGIGREFILGRARGAAQPRRVIQPGPVAQQAGITALPAIIGAGRRFAPGIGRLAGNVISGGLGYLAGRQGGDGACPSGSHPNKQDGVGGAAGTYCVKNRRMNFGNARAARRSVRRLKGARKLLRDIEKMMPTKTRTRTVKVHHDDHHAHH